MWTYWEYSSCFRRKLGEGKYLSLYHNWENLSLYFYFAFLYCHYPFNGSAWPMDQNLIFHVLLTFCGTSWCLHDNYHQTMFCANTGDAYVRCQGGGAPGCPWDLPNLVVTICWWLHAHSVSVVWLWKMTLAQKRWLDYILMEFCKIDICTGGAMTVTSWGNIS